MLLVDKRLQKELQTIDRTPMENISVSLTNDNLREWTIFIKGPDQSPYINGIFKLRVNFTENYPFEAPTAVFVTPIIHPNISIDGTLCIDTLKNWKANLSVQTVLLSILSIMASPNLNNALVPEIANLYKSDYEKYVLLAKKYTKKYAGNICHNVV